MHLFPQLRKIERKFSREVTVISLRSANFAAEKETESLRRATLRYEIEYPVENDRDFQLWREHTVGTWPTLMLIGPAGKIIGKHHGEITQGMLDRFVSELVDEYDEKGLIQRSELTSNLEKEKESSRARSFPGKILADAVSSRIFIGDSNHNRMVITDFDGNAQHVIGSVDQGFSDGTY